MSSGPEQSLRKLVPGEGIEPPTNGLQNRCSTAELARRTNGMGKPLAFCRTSENATSVTHANRRREGRTSAHTEPITRAPRQRETAPDRAYRELVDFRNGIEVPKWPVRRRIPEAFPYPFPS